MSSSTAIRDASPGGLRGAPNRRLTAMRTGAGGLRRVPWILAFPAVALLLAFHFIPVAAGAWYAFTDWNGLSAPHFVGFANFSSIFSDAETRDALVHTLEVAGAFVVGANAIGLMLALSLNRVVRTRNLLRALFFAPAAFSPIAVAFVWQYVFIPNGALNGILGGLGLHSLEQAWLGSPTFALWTIVVVLIWQFSGLTMIIYLAGLQGIPDELYEAAAVDGASLRTQFRGITLPLLAPAMTVSTTLTLVFGLRVFDQVIALTDGGPVNSTQTLATEIYQQTFTYGRFGYGAALAVILTLLIAVLVFAQLAFLRMREARI